MRKDVIDFMLARKSPPIEELTEPGPSQADIETMLRVATRVPDHGRLEPWRFILYRGPVRRAIGELLVERAVEREGPLPEARLEKERTRFSRAPLVIGVVSSPKDNPKIPEWEMFLSGGAVAMNLVHAAHALGYGANWISNWYSEEEEGRRLVGIAPHEKAVGFVHIGTFAGKTVDRPRPDLSRIVSDYAGPWSE